MKLFHKKAGNPKKVDPDAYYHAKRRGIWVPMMTKRAIEDFAEQTDRNIPTAIDDLVAQAVPYLSVWPQSAYLQALLEQQQEDLGVRLVHVHQNASSEIERYATREGIGLGQALQQIAFCGMTVLNLQGRSEKLNNSEPATGQGPTSTRDQNKRSMKSAKTSKDPILRLIGGSQRLKTKRDQEKSTFTELLGRMKKVFSQNRDSDPPGSPNKKVR